MNQEEKWKYISEQVMNLKKKSKLISNAYGRTSFEICDIYKDDNSLAYIVQETGRKRAYFYAIDEESLIHILQKLPLDIVLEYLYKKEDELKSTFENAGMKLHTTFVREQSTYSRNQYTIEEKGRRALLKEMYDPSMCEYALESDIPEIMMIMEKLFDKRGDDFFTAEEWKKCIENKEVVIIREKGAIVSLYKFILKGKVLYSNVSFNLGPANYLYNLERSVTDMMWEKGIHSFYAWTDLNNRHAQRRKKVSDQINDIIVSRTVIYNDIFVFKSKG